MEPLLPHLITAALVYGRIFSIASSRVSLLVRNFSSVSFGINTVTSGSTFFRSISQRSIGSHWLSSEVVTPFCLHNSRIFSKSRLIPLCIKIEDICICLVSVNTSGLISLSDI